MCLPLGHRLPEPVPRSRLMSEPTPCCMCPAGGRVRVTRGAHWSCGLVLPVCLTPFPVASHSGPVVLSGAPLMSLPLLTFQVPRVQRGGWRQVLWREVLHERTCVSVCWMPSPWASWALLALLPCEREEAQLQGPGWR